MALKTVDSEGAGDFRSKPRWSAGKKMEVVVLRLLRGEKLESLSRELGVESHRLFTLARSRCRSPRARFSVRCGVGCNPGASPRVSRGLSPRAESNMVPLLPSPRAISAWPIGSRRGRFSGFG
jgi:hypothetical protein